MKRYNFEILLISLKGMTISFPEVSVFSDIKHSSSVSYINDPSVFLSPSLISRMKNPLNKLVPHSHDMKVLTHFNIPVCKRKTYVLSTLFPNKLVSLYVKIFICEFICMLVCQYIYQCMTHFIFYRVDVINISSVINLFLSGGILGKTAQFWLMYTDMMKNAASSTYYCARK